MADWIAYHIYPLEAPDVFLTRALRPFLDTYIWSRQGARAFFIRYEDEHGLHIRLRLRAETEWLEETLRPALTAWFDGRGELRLAPYIGEADRFGGPEGVAWAEEHFHLSTRVVLDRLTRPDYTFGDAMFDGLRLHAAAVFAAGFDRLDAARYFDRLCEQWMPLFFQPADEAGQTDAYAGLRDQFAVSFEHQQEEISLSLNELWLALENEKFDPDQPEWVRWFRGNQFILKEMEPYLEKALPSLLHLTHNRLGINNQNEVYLVYVLSKGLGGSFI